MSESAEVAFLPPQGAEFLQVEVSDDGGDWTRIEVGGERFRPVADLPAGGDLESMGEWWLSALPDGLYRARWSPGDRRKILKVGPVFEVDGGELVPYEEAPAEAAPIPAPSRPRRAPLRAPAIEPPRPPARPERVAAARRSAVIDDDPSLRRLLLLEEVATNRAQLLVSANMKMMETVLASLHQRHEVTMETQRQRHELAVEAVRSESERRHAAELAVVEGRIARVEEDGALVVPDTDELLAELHARAGETESKEDFKQILEVVLNSPFAQQVGGWIIHMANERFGPKPPAPAPGA